MSAPNLEQLNADIGREFPSFKVVYKAESTLMRAVNVVLSIVTLGNSKMFMSDFTTTIGNTVYVPSTWSMMSTASQCVTLRHERVHMRQAKKMSFLLFALLYVFFPLPLGLAWCRAKFEMEAYAETLRAWNEYGANITQTGFRQDVIDHFLTGQYGWMWPFRKSIETWYDLTASQVLAGK